MRRYVGRVMTLCTLNVRVFASEQREGSEDDDLVVHPCPCYMANRVMRWKIQLLSLSLIVTGGLTYEELGS